MAVDAEFISSEDFNLKFKNYLRDFYIYQFKERGSDFKTKGTNDKSNVNKDVINSTFYSDAKRLKYALEQSAGVQWNKGEFVDIHGEKAAEKREKNKRVECVTVDSRRIERNPFFSLYQLCSESALTPGTHFSFIYTLLLYFQLGSRVKRTDSIPLNVKQIDKLNEHLEYLAEIIESDERRHAPKSWKEFTYKDKETFAKKAVNNFIKDRSQLEEDCEHELLQIYDYILLNKKKIIFIDGKFSLTNDDSNFVEKNMLFRIMQMYKVGVNVKQFGNKMNELTRLGVVKCEKRGQRIFYALSDIFLNDVLPGNDDLRVRMSDCISFFAQTHVLGEIGSYILNRLSKIPSNYIRFKHNYIKRALNDYNNVDLLYAIKNKLWAVVEYRNASLNDLEYQKIICYPIEIRESVSDGRQYLIYYHPYFRSVSAIRIEFIDNIILGKLPKEKYFDDDMKSAETLIGHTWGTAFDKFQEGNVKTPFEPNRVRVIIKLENNEGFIKARLQREARKCALFDEIELDDYGRCIEVVAEVANPWEMLQWLRSYITRVVVIEINGKEFSGFNDDVIRTYESYIEPSPKTTANISSRTGKSIIRDDIPDEFVQVDAVHGLLFNEIFGIAFNKLGETLLSLIKQGKLSHEFIKELKSDYAQYFLSDQFSEVTQWDTEDKRLEQADGFIRAFITHQGDQINSIFSLIDEHCIDNPMDLLPLTSIETQWICNVLSHPLAKCFLSDSEIACVLDRLGEIDLFDVNSVVLHDQYIGVDNFYQTPNFGETIKNIIMAIRENRMIKIKYQSQYGRQSNYVCAPVYIEYSKRDNRIRIRAVSKSDVVKTFNLERILDVAVMEDFFDKDASQQVVENDIKENERELVIFFNETKNVPDRILTEFSCFKKKCIKWGSERYRMTLYYDKEDTREILVRLLSYGPLINVFDDTGDVRHELIERLEHQLELTKCMDLVFSNEFAEVISEQRES